MIVNIALLFCSILFFLAGVFYNRKFHHFIQNGRDPEIAEIVE